jgi:hypothetical protein
MDTNTPFPSLMALHGDITNMSRLPAGRDGGPAIEVYPDSIHRSILLIEDVIGTLVPTRVEDNPISGRVMMRWVRPWGELLLEIPPHRDRYVYHLHPTGGLTAQGEVVSITSLIDLLWKFLRGSQVPC